MGLSEEAIEHVKVLRDAISLAASAEAIEAINALVGMLPQEFSDAECKRWALNVWENPITPLSQVDIITAREELTRLAASGGHITWDDDG